MKTIVLAACSLLMVASLVLGAGLPATKLHGEYIEARTADVYTGPCFANSETGLTGDVAVFGWKIEKGLWQGVNLDGLAVMGVIRASNTLGDETNTVYPVKSVVIIDERANAEQRMALKSFAQRMGGDLLQQVVKVEYQPVEFTMDGNIHTRKATMTAGKMAKIETRAITEGDQICHNEEVWYQPLTKLDHAMAAVAVSHNFKGKGLGMTWSSPDKRSAYVGTFQYQE